MKSYTSLIFGIVSLVIVLGLITWVIRSRPSENEIANAVSALPALPTTELNDNVFKPLTDRQMHGTLPVAPLPPEPTRSDPFN